MESMTFHCPNCSANIIYNDRTGKIKCNYCNCEFDPSEIKVDYDTNSEFSLYSCGNCGAKLITNKKSITAHCSYCDSNQVIKQNIINEYKPDKIITFRHDENTIKSELLKYLNRKLFGAKVTEQNIMFMHKLYVPYFVYSGNLTLATYLSYPSSDKGVAYAYVSGIVNFDNIPVDGKVNINNDFLSGIEPFNFKEGIAFNPVYLTNTYAETYDKEVEMQLCEEAKRKIECMALDYAVAKAYYQADISIGRVDYLNAAIPFYRVESQSNINVINKLNYVLVPIWFIKIHSGGKIYDYAVNDQHLIVSGNTPISNLKIAILASLCLIISMIEFFFKQDEVLFAINLIMTLTICVGIRFFISLKYRQKKYNKRRYINTEKSAIKISKL